MRRETNTAKTLPAPLDDRVMTALRALSEKKATEIALLNISSVASFTDYFIIGSGTSTRQVQAIADEVIEKLRERQTRPLHIEGQKTGEWILIDFGDFIVHIFLESARKFYDLERLWRDAEVVSLPEEIS